MIFQAKMIIPPENFNTSSLQRSPWGDKICQLLSVTIDSADPEKLVQKAVSLDGQYLNILTQSIDLRAFQSIFIFGLGKAAVPMASAIIRIIGDHSIAGLIITKDGYDRQDYSLPLEFIKAYTAGHPIPDQRNINTTAEFLSLVNKFTTNNLVICLISGGGSSLMVKPAMGITLQDIQLITELLIACGATIDELNTIRKHLDKVKGGGLSRHIYPTTVVSLILSDVIGDNLDVIASGPTSPDPTTYQDAWKILNKYNLIDQVPKNVLSHLTSGIAGDIPDTLKPGDPIFQKTHNFIIGNNRQLVVDAVQIASNLGFDAHLLPFPLTGEASQVGHTIVYYAKSSLINNRFPYRLACLIAGGETTVKVKGSGTGGRNQELVLGAVEHLSGEQPIMLVSLATDGGDGSTDAAGAIATNQTLSDGLAKGFSPADYLKRNDSYHYFDQLGDLIKIGPTMTNVNDLVFLFG
jgi:glycerate 2-kinase